MIQDLMAGLLPFDISLVICIFRFCVCVPMEKMKMVRNLTHTCEYCFKIEIFLKCYQLLLGLKMLGVVALFHSPDLESHAAAYFPL